MIVTPLNTETQQLHAFVDGELDLARQLEIEARLRDDATLRAQLEGVQRLRSAIREGADYHAAPAALRAALGSLVAAPPVSPIAPPAAASTPLSRLASARAAARRWLAWRPLVVSFGAAAMLAVALNLTLSQAGHEQRLRAEVIASHVRAKLTQRLVDVASSDRHTVKPWLSSRLDFSPPVHALNLPGSVFVGGRIDYLDGRPVAVRVYRQGAHSVDAFVWPSDAGDQRLRFSSSRGFELAHWSRGGMAHWVISDLGREQLAAVVREIDPPEERSYR